MFWPALAKLYITVMDRDRKPIAAVPHKNIVGLAKIANTFMIIN